MYPENWEKVNINELTEKYTPGIVSTISGTKLMTYYGGKIPNTPFPPDPRIKEFPLNEQDCELLCEDFVDSINVYCDTLLDDGDVDYFDKAKCLLLKSRIEKRLPSVSNERLKSLYGKLLEFANRAIELGTGVVVEL